MTSRLLIRNSAAGILQFILTAILTLISVPVFISKLGFELYGVFAVVSVIGNLNMLTNLGLNGALLVYVAKQGKCKESDLDIIVTQTILGTMAVIFLAIVVLFRTTITASLISVPEPYIQDANQLLLFLFVANMLLLMGQSFTAVIDSVQKVYLTNLAQFIYSLIYWIGIISVVSLNGGLVQVGYVALAAAVIWFIIVFAIFRKIWGKYDLSGFFNDFKRIAKKQLAYGSKIYMSGLVGFMFEPLSKILLSNFVGVHAVALYEIGIKIKSQISGLISKALYPLYPFIAGRNDDANLKNRLYDLSKKILLIVIPLSIIVAFCLSYLVKLWLGSNYVEEAPVFVIVLTVSMLLFSPPILPIYQYNAAKNRAEKNIWIQSVNSSVNIFLFLFLFKFYGLYTILISNSLALFSSFILGNYYQYKYLRVNYWKDRNYYALMLLFAFLCIVTCFATRNLIPVSAWDLVIFPLTVGLSFILYVRFFRLISSDDIHYYFDSLPFLKSLVKRTFT